MDDQPSIHDLRKWRQDLEQRNRASAAKLAGVVRRARLEAQRELMERRVDEKQQNDETG